jgi:hypothetical protein
VAGGGALPLPKTIVPVTMFVRLPPNVSKDPERLSVIVTTLVPDGNM